MKKMGLKFWGIYFLLSIPIVLVSSMLIEYIDVGSFDELFPVSTLKKFPLILLIYSILLFIFSFIKKLDSFNKKWFASSLILIFIITIMLFVNNHDFYLWVYFMSIILSITIIPKSAYILITKGKYSQMLKKIFIFIFVGILIYILYYNRNLLKFQKNKISTLNTIDNLIEDIKKENIKISKKDYVLEVIRNGSNKLEFTMGMMPPGMASGKDAEDVAAYVAGGLKGKQPVAWAACASCHGADGTGMNKLTPNLTKKQFIGMDYKFNDKFRLLTNFKKFIENTELIITPSKEACERYMDGDYNEEYKTCKVYTKEKAISICENYGARPSNPNEINIIKDFCSLSIDYSGKGTISECEKSLGIYISMDEYSRDIDKNIFCIKKKDEYFKEN